MTNCNRFCYIYFPDLSIYRFKVSEKVINKNMCKSVTFFLWCTGDPSFYSG